MGEGVRIHLLGQVCVESADRVIEGGVLPGRQGRVAFAYLALNQRAVPRAELAEVVWPDALPRSWERDLSAVVSKLKGPLAGIGLTDAVRGALGCYQLVLPEGAVVDVDSVWRFVEDAEIAMRNGDVDAALAAATTASSLAHRPFLPGDAGRWVEERRSELATLLVRALEVLAGVHAARRQFADAVRYAEEVVAREPFHESGWAALIGLHLAAGNRAEALRAYGRVRALLAEELGVNPSAALEAAYQRALFADAAEAGPSGAATAPTAASDMFIFIGRSWERREIADVVAQTRAGSGGLVLIAGEPGIGKSLLARRAVLDASDVDTIWASCWEGDDAPPYWPWVQVVRRLYDRLPDTRAVDRAALAVLVPDLIDAEPLDTSADPVGARARLFDAVVSLLEAVTTVTPVVVVIDDLHWADPPSVLLLRHLAPRISGLAMATIATYRDLELDANPIVADVVAGLARFARSFHLRGLTDDELGELVAGLARQEASPEWISTLGERTGGNPFFAREVVRLLLAQGYGVDGSLAVVPPSVRAVMEHRLARLPPPVRELLELASTVGERFTMNELGIGGDTSATALDSLDVADRAGLIRIGVGGFLFAHALVRQAVYENIGRARRARLHEMVGDTLAQLGAPPAVVAHHFLQAVPVTGPDRTVDRLLEAGEAALAALGHEEASGWFDRALELLGPADGPPARRALLGRAEASRRSGERRSARRDFDAVVASARAYEDPVDLALAALGVQRLGFQSGWSHREPIELLEEAARGLQGDEHLELRALVLSALARELWDHTAHRGADAAAAADEGLRLAERAGSQTALSRCLEARYTVAWGPGTAAERAVTAQRMVAVARASGDEEQHAIAELLLAAAQIELGDAEGLEAMYRFFAIADRLRLPRLSYLATIRRAALAIMTGELDEARHLIDHVERVGHDLDEPDAPNVVGNLWWALARCEGNASWLAGRELPEPGPRHTQLFDKVWRPVILLDAGRNDEALRAFNEIAGVDLTMVRQDWIYLYDIADLAQVALRFGDLTVAARCRAALAPYTGLTCVAAAFGAWGGAVDHHLGASALALGNLRDAVGHLEAALRVHKAFGAGPWIEATQSLLAAAKESYGRSTG